MSSSSDWEMPLADQPKPENYTYDLEGALTSLVGLRAIVPADAFTADILGTERAGSGVVIRESGLVLTIGYLITEAENVWLTGAKGQAVPAHALGYDQETGFGLVQALGSLDLPALELGSAKKTKVGDPVILAGGSNQFIRGRSSASRNSPATGSTCSTRRSSPRRRTCRGAAPA